MEGVSFEVGQWWLCRDGETLANIVGEVFNNQYPFSIVFYKDGELEWTDVCDKEGKVGPDRLDLIEFLPHCKAPDYKVPAA